MTAYWLTLDDGSKVCCEGFDKHYAQLVTEKLTSKKVKEISRIPYPSSPCIWQFDDPLSGKTPLFCKYPDKCAGRISCASEFCCID
jgi:hypothetical protein